MSCQQEIIKATFWRALYVWDYLKTAQMNSLFQRIFKSPLGATARIGVTMDRTVSPTIYGQIQILMTFAAPSPRAQ